MLFLHLFCAVRGRLASYHLSPSRMPIGRIRPAYPVHPRLVLCGALEGDCGEQAIWHLVERQSFVHPVLLA